MHATQRCCCELYVLSTIMPVGRWTALQPNISWLPSAMSSSVCALAGAQMIITLKLIAVASSYADHFKKDEVRDRAFQNLFTLRR